MEYPRRHAAHLMRLSADQNRIGILRQDLNTHSQYRDHSLRAIAKNPSFACRQSCRFAAFRKYFDRVSGMRNGEITACPSKAWVFSGAHMLVWP
jgi:hypothetical protein